MGAPAIERKTQMGETTGISWTDHTWNPWSGCTKAAGHLLDGVEHHEMPNDTKETN